ncbi:hypothetical protein TREES_T100020508 [Tupaia chinensis]|uniref:Uncharacterized protein n=1 Tax=Tupaia chinensis TaxID=246437 RepID=L9L0X4_TUPCH|nr:hypothetical protein TREES_T100020508 [Tupaia chinensis]
MPWQQSTFLPLLQLKTGRPRSGQHLLEGQVQTLFKGFTPPEARDNEGLMRMVLPASSKPRKGPPQLISFPCIRGCKVCDYPFDVSGDSRGSAAPCPVGSASARHPVSLDSGHALSSTQWNHLPPGNGPGSTEHRYFRRHQTDVFGDAIGLPTLRHSLWAVKDSSVDRSVDSSVDSSVDRSVDRSVPRKKRGEQILTCLKATPLLGFGICVSQGVLSCLGKAGMDLCPLDLQVTPVTERGGTRQKFTTRGRREPCSKQLCQVSARWDRQRRVRERCLTGQQHP